MTHRLFLTRRGDRDRNLFAVCVEGDELVYCGWHRAQRLAAFLNDWQPDDQQLATFLHWQGDEARTYIASMRRITLRWPAVCVRCGQPVAAGERAAWDADTRLVVHGLRCPLRVPTTTRQP